MSYRIDSDIYLPYGYVSEKESTSVLAPYPPKWSNSSVVRSMPVLPPKWRQHQDNRKLVSWVVSNCKTHSKREEYVEVKKLHKNIFDLFLTTWGTQRALPRLLIVIPAVYPHLVVNYPLNIESQTQAKNIPVALPSFPIKI